MICKDCAAEADRRLNTAVFHCSECGRQIAVYRTDVPYRDLRVVVHKDGLVRCYGSTRPPVPVGHEKCKQRPVRSCDCAHRPKVVE